MIDLRELSRRSDPLSSEVYQFHVAAAGVCLDHAGHDPDDTTIEVHLTTQQGDEQPLRWSAPDDVVQRSHRDLQDATEHGAYALSFVLIEQETGMPVVEQSWKGTGCDWWVGEPNPERVGFQGCSRLEVSGILGGSASELEQRVREKLLQVSRPEREERAYVVVVAFGRPMAKVASSHE
jgi:hypothetical protein